jgi:thiamine-monophosphate kinase
VEASEIDEFGLRGRIKKRFAANTLRGRPGMGDDAAILSLTPGNKVVATVDLLLEGIHFSLSPISPKILGRKSLAANRSEFAARGAFPDMVS